MTGWIIFGSILLVLIIVLVQSVSVTAIYDKEPELRIKIAFITIVKVPPDPEKEKKKAAKKAKKARKEAERAMKKKPPYNKALLSDAEDGKQDGAAADDTDETSVKSVSESTSDNSSDKSGEDTKKAAEPKKAKRAKKGLPKLDFNMITDFIKSATPPIKRLFKKIRIRNLYIDWVVGSDDAAKTALKYGGLCAAIYSAVELLKTSFDTKVGEINIEADFDAEKDDIFAYITMKLRISTAIACGVWLLFRLARTYLKYNAKPKTVHRPQRAGAK